MRSPARRLAVQSVTRSIARSALRKSSATRRATTRLCGHCRYPGRGDKQLATICHVDVVPAGPGWNTDPFAMERREGWLLGRGVIDDKGPAVLSLYAGAYLLKHGITPRYTFRALLGCDEEVGMSDVHHYLENHADPDFLFTPDAEFPVCNAEKGQFGATFVSSKIDGGRIVS